MNRFILCFLFLSVILYLPPATAEEPEEPIQEHVHEPVKATSPFDQVKFNPTLSLILDFSAVYRNLDNGYYSNLVSPGETYSTKSYENLFWFPEREYRGGTGPRGFNLNYGDLLIVAAVDPYFDLKGAFTIGYDSFEIDEAYFTTRSLPGGFGIKAGKFLSGFGRINSIHSHAWNFSDAPAINSLLFGPGGLNETGLGITWQTPLDLYLVLGAEIFKGDNESSFGTSAFRLLNIPIVKAAQYPDLAVGYVKTSFDLDKTTVLLGASCANGMTRRAYEINEGLISGFIHGNSVIYGTELTVKHQADSIRSITLQGEYFYRVTNAKRYTAEASLAAVSQKYMQRQSGFYSQLVGKPAKRIALGLRYDLLVHTGKPGFVFLPRYSGMIEFVPTEFSRIRLQYNHDLTQVRQYNQFDLRRRLNQEVILQFTMAIGAHGAHSF